MSRTPLLDQATNDTAYAELYELITELTEVLETTHEAWREQSVCADPKLQPLFFPSVGKSNVANEAKAVCATCPVRAECLEYALKHHIERGIWGGLTDDERRVELRKRKRQSRNAA